MAILSLKNGLSSISGATVKGDFSYFSGGTRALGPSDVTGFYSGYDAPIGGYTVYQIYGASGFTATVANNNTELNYILIRIGGTGTTVEQNITWAANTSSVFVNVGPPIIVYTYNLFGCCQPYPYNCDEVTVYSQSPSIVVGTQFYSDSELSAYVSCAPGYYTLFKNGECNSGTIIYDGILVNASGVVESVTTEMDCIP
jgi:hypothetical protein